MSGTRLMAGVRLVKRLFGRTQSMRARFRMAKI